MKNIVSDEGFEINEKKTRYLSNDVKKSITGITINNEEIHVDKKLKRDIRALIFSSIASKNYALNDKIRGSIAYVNSIEPGYQEKMINYIERIINKDELKNDLGVVKTFNENKLYKVLPDMKYEESPFI